MLFVINWLIKWRRCSKSLMLWAHSHQQGSVAGPNQCYLKSKKRNRDVWSTDKRSASRTRSWWGPRRTKRSGKRGRRKRGNVLRGCLKPRQWICCDNRLRKKDTLHLSKQGSSCLNASSNARACWNVKKLIDELEFAEHEASYLCSFLSAMPAGDDKQKYDARRRAAYSWSVLDKIKV